MFLLGRFAVVAVHETAHGLAMASFGRRVREGRAEAGRDLPVRVRGHERGVVRAAPAADRDQRGRAGRRTSRSARSSRSAASRCPAGTVRDIFFQLAFAGYVGAFFNLNPFIERDGYHMLVDWLREPGLRRRAREQFARRLSGQGALERLAGARALLASGASSGRCWRAGSRSRCRCATRRILTRSRRTGSSTSVLGTLWVAFFVPGASWWSASRCVERAPRPCGSMSRGRRLSPRSPRKLIERLLADPAFRDALPARPGDAPAARPGCDEPRRGDAARRRARRCTRSTSASRARAWPA